MIRVLNTEVERNSKIKTNLVYFIYLITTNLFRMEPVNLGYSDKNIPIAKPREYLKCLIEKTESFLRRVRWKACNFSFPLTSRTACK